MWSVERLFQKRKECGGAGFGCDLGDGCACFIDKLTSGEWKISKLDNKDRVAYIRILPANIGNIEFKKALAEMLDAR